MTKKEKQLLLKDLCGRILYGVKVNINSSIEEQNWMELFDVNIDSKTIGVGNDKWAFRAVPVEDEDGKVVKPYLRSMESMINEEIDRMWEIYESGPAAESSVAVAEYLYERHLDCHYLIEKGLALEAPEGMYKIESL